MRGKVLPGALPWSQLLGASNRSFDQQLRPPKCWKTGSQNRNLKASTWPLAKAAVMMARMVSLVMVVDGGV